MSKRSVFQVDLTITPDPAILVDLTRSDSEDGLEVIEISSDSEYDNSELFEARTGNWGNHESNNETLQGMHNAIIDWIDDQWNSKMGDDNIFNDNLLFNEDNLFNDEQF